MSADLGRHFNRHMRSERYLLSAMIDAAYAHGMRNPKFDEFGMNDSGHAIGLDWIAFICLEERLLGSKRNFIKPVRLLCASQAYLRVYDALTATLLSSSPVPQKAFFTVLCPRPMGALSPLVREKNNSD